MLLMFCVSAMPLSAKDDHNLTEVQLHAVLGIITNFILSSDEKVIIQNGTRYGTVKSPYTGKTWLDRNLGASKVCTSMTDTACYGDYYQWGRNFDGHQESNSTLSAVQATDINNAGASFITASTAETNHDWAKDADTNGSLRATNLAKLDGSSVCPKGFRVPTINELKAELFDIGSAQIENSNDAFTSFLKLPSANSRDNGSGSVSSIVTQGALWANSIYVTPSDMESQYIGYEGAFGESSGEAYVDATYRAYGHSVRCIQSNVSTVPNIPIFTSDNNVSVDEGSSIATTLLTGSTTNVQYEILDEGDSSYFDINATTGVITFKAAPDFATKSLYTIVVVATTDTGDKAWQFVHMHILDTTPPLFTSDDNATVAENQTDAITLVATDASAISYSISGADSSSFDVNATTGVVTFKIAPDFETLDTYTFTATATDAYGNASTQEVTIYISDVVENVGVKKTGQTKSYDENGTEVLDGSSKDDGFYQKGVEPSYTRDDATQIVTDHITGLQWADDANVSSSSMKKPWLTATNYDICKGQNGQTQDTSKCTDTSGDTAATYCASLTLGGESDWRLPSIEELVFVTDKGRVRPAIHPIFENVNTGSYYWSSTTSDSGTDFAWVVYFYDGDDSGIRKTYSSYVRCVRDGQ